MALFITGLIIGIFLGAYMASKEFRGKVNKFVQDQRKKQASKKKEAK